jgi:hypothetical protein
VHGVNFEDAKTRLVGAARRLGERGNDLLNAVAREFSRHGIVLGKGQRARRTDQRKIREYLAEAVEDNRSGEKKASLWKRIFG